MRVRLALGALALALAMGEALAGVLFSTLPNSLEVQASVVHGARDSSWPANEAKAGRDSISVTWSLRSNSTQKAQEFSTLSLKLCFSKESQKDRGWRKEDNDLAKDKACSTSIIKSVQYSPSGNFTWLVAKDVPRALYFVRIYARDAAGTEVAYGQTNPSSDFITVIPISGRHASLDIATAVFSAFSVFSLFGFFTAEKIKARKKKTQASH